VSFADFDVLARLRNPVILVDVDGTTFVCSARDLTCMQFTGQFFDGRGRPDVMS